MTQGRALEDTQLSQMVSWLDEQRKLDKDQILSLQQDIERLSLSVRELTAHIHKVGDDLTQGQSRISTLPLMEEGVRQARQQLLILQQRVDESQELQGKEVLLRQAEAERDHRALVDVGQQILEIRQLIEAGGARVRSVADEVTRTRASVEILPGQIESVDKSVSGIGSRVLVLEETARRQESRIALLEKSVETLQSDFSRILQWQQAADLRWTRQISGWQQQMEDWQREGDDRGKLVQQFVKQISSVKEDVQQVRLGLAQIHQSSEDQAAVLTRFEGIRVHDREEVHRVEQGVDAQRRRIDEQVGAIKQLQEQFLQGVQEISTVGSRVDTGQRRVEELVAQLSLLDQRQRQGVEVADQLRREIREVGQKIDQHIQRWLLQVEEDRHRAEEQVGEAQRMEEQAKLREIAELERQIAEIRERFSKVRAS
ncbi:MAG: hypothetical protein M1358_14110 [Chloroflexi bacterium]|nr:hypothetical protein [Chloroflexota bacterium]